MDNINNSQNKRMLARAGNLNLKYLNNTISSTDFSKTATTYEQTYVSNLIANTNIHTTMKIVDYKIDMDGRIIVIGEGGEEIVLNIGSGFDNYIQTLLQTTDGGYLVGGDFATYSSVPTNFIIRLNQDGGIDNTFNSGSGFDDSVISLQQTTDGGYLVGGDFISYSGQTANRIIKLKSDGSIDDTFNSGDGFNEYVNSLTETTDGGYLVGGGFISYSGQTANRIIKLKSDGSIDDTFNSGSGFDNTVWSLLQTTDGGYLVGGYFTLYSGQTANYIIKLKSDGSRDTSFNSGSGFDDSVISLQQTTDGGYLVGGDFISYSGQTANRIIKLKSDGSIDETFNSGDGFDDYVQTLLQTTDGGYLVGGNFTSYQGQTANRIIKLKLDGDIDDSFNSGSGFDNYINSLLQTTDGGYLVGGYFISYSGQTAKRIIKLKSDGTSNTISE